MIPRRPLRRIIVLLEVVALAATIWLGLDILRAGGLDGWLAARGPQLVWLQPAPYVPQGHTVEVDGRAIYIDCRGSGSPTVILEAGFGANAANWAQLLDDTAPITRVCAWDRPGVGRSEARGLHTGRDTVADLRAALAVAGEHGPYVVVAHSLGGVYALLFADLEASEGLDDVVGLVQLDSFEPLIWLADDPGLDQALRDQHRQVLAETGAMFEQYEQLDWDPTVAEVRTLPPTQVETVMLPIEMARKFGDQAEPGPAALAAAWYRVVEEHYPNGRVEVVTNSGHAIGTDRPELVAARVREMVEAVRARET